MGPPVLNFKFLPDRCHRGRNRESLQPEKEEVAGAGGPTSHCSKLQPAFLSGVALVWQEGTSSLQLAKP